MKQFDKREVIGGLLVLFVGVLIGSFWLSDVAAPAVGFFTSLGSIATFFTLVFLIWQNDKIQKAQKIRDAEDSLIKKSQYLEYRKKNFYSLLEEFKNETEIPVVFASTYSLYRKIYPASNIKSNNYDKASSEFTSKLKATFNEIQSNLYSLDAEEKIFRNLNSLFHSLDEFQTLLNFELAGPNLVRNLQNGKNITNVFKFSNTLDTYYQVAITMCSECDIECDLQIFSISETAINKLEKAMFGNGGIGKYDMGVPSYARRIIALLHRLYTLSFDQQTGETDINYYQLDLLMRLFVLEDAFWDVVSDKNKLLSETHIHINALDSMLFDTDSYTSIQKLSLENLKQSLEREHKALQSLIEKENSE